MLEKGSIVFGHWTIDEKIGAGAYGTVYKLKRNEFGTDYQSALKVISIPPENTDSSSLQSEGMTVEEISEYYADIAKNFMEEIKLLEELKGNSNIVSYEDHVVAKSPDGLAYTILIRMELLVPLKTRMQERTFDKKEICKLGIDICNALELCEKRKIIHRDIKPDNIFISNSDTYKLGDFGVARTMEKTVAAMSQKGTYSYMAPEIFLGKEYNQNVDLYSLGILLYQFLNKNRTPFLPDAPSTIKFSDREKAQKRRMSGELLPEIKGLSRAWNFFLLTACHPDPQKRFQSASQMRGALEKLMAEEDAQTIIENRAPVNSAPTPVRGYVPGNATPTPVRVEAPVNTAPTPAHAEAPVNSTPTPVQGYVPGNATPTPVRVEAPVNTAPTPAHVNAPVNSAPPSIQKEVVINKAPTENSAPINLNKPQGAPTDNKASGEPQKPIKAKEEVKKPKKSREYLKWLMSETTSKKYILFFIVISLVNAFIANCFSEYFWGQENLGVICVFLIPVLLIVKLVNLIIGLTGKNGFLKSVPLYLVTFFLNFLLMGFFSDNYVYYYFYEPTFANYFLLAIGINSLFIPFILGCFYKPGRAVLGIFSRITAYTSTIFFAILKMDLVSYVVYEWRSGSYLSEIVTVVVFVLCIALSVVYPIVSKNFAKKEN